MEVAVTRLSATVVAEIIVPETLNASAKAVKLIPPPM